MWQGLTEAYRLAYAFWDWYFYLAGIVFGLAIYIGAPLTIVWLLIEGVEQWTKQCKSTNSDENSDT